ncbi:MAG TPA: chemotaxis protein CheB, partial [Flavitalea sp.]|nr:chemotaxis protein CheB [Flavitalea sp.]
MQTGSKKMAGPQETVLKEKGEYVVGIGASAGGLEAIHEFFDNMPETTNMSFVIIQHLSPDYKSLLVDLVSRHTHMKVFEAEDNLPVRKNCIYVIPNNKMITIRNNHLRLEAKKQNLAPNNAIDIFLGSLATEKKNQAIAVILSGTGSDGTRGIEEIKQQGGIVIVQDPGSARFDGMPLSAIQSGNADLILKPSEMPQEIAHFTENPVSDNSLEFDEKKLDVIFSLIHQEVGHDFHYYKLPTINRRVARRMSQLNIHDIDEYIVLLQKDSEEARTLGKEFLIGVTRFFRDKDAFDYLAAELIPELINSKQADSLLKVWICACSTGEEAYSLAILFVEAMENVGKNLELKIFATDIDDSSIHIATKGIYPLTIEKDVPADLLEKYFIKSNSHYQVVPMIRKQIVFAKHDVIKDPPFINNDFVSCRNMLIYMSPALQTKIMAVLSFSILRGGYLFLGSSESSSLIRDSVVDVNSRLKIFRKTADARMGAHYLSAVSNRRLSDFEKRNNPLPAARSKPKQLWDALKLLLTEDLHFAAFFVDQSFDIKETFGNYERFLELPKKSLHLNLLNMVPSEVYFLLNTEARNARKENKTIILPNVKHRSKGRQVSWRIIIKPLQPYSVIVISENESVEIEETPVSELRPADQVADYIKGLEEEIAELRQHLQLAVEDLETTNEELQSSNEELLSGNEELQSSNEELQSLNEELHTLNTEHQLKIKELVELNDDLNNYFRSTDIGQVFLDSDLRIRKFNPACAEMINFIDSDIGRPISHISNNIAYDDFLKDVRSVLNGRETVEKELSLFNGRNVLMRIMPYITRDKKANGVIISFVDITVIINLNNTIRSVLDSNPSAIMAFKSVRDNEGVIDFTLETANNAAGQLLQRPVHEAIGTTLKNKMPLLSQLYEQYVQVVLQDRNFHKDEYFQEETKWFAISATKMMDGFVTTFTDITAKKLAEEKLRKNYSELVAVKDHLKLANTQLEQKVRERTRELSEKEERFRLVARATNDALWDWDLMNNKIWFGETFFKIFGYEGDAEYYSRSYWMDKVHPDDLNQVNASIHAAINGSQAKWSCEYRFRKKDGDYTHILDRGYILHDEFGTPYRMLGSMFDLTQIKTAEQQVATTIAQQKFLAESMPLIVWTSDVNGNVNFVNRQFELYTGHSYKEALGNGWQQFFFPAQLPALKALWTKALDQLEDFSIELKVLHKTGKYHWNILRARAGKDALGNLQNLVITLIDINDQKVMNEVLEHKVIERTRELKEINHALELSNNDLQQFASVASHDLQEPLRKIQMFAKLIKDRSEDVLNENSRQYLEKILNSSRRMKLLIIDILNYS